MTLKISGAQTFVEYLQEVADELVRARHKAGFRAHGNALKQMRKAKIPIGKTGDLARSLRKPNDPKHIWEETEKGFDFGSSYRGARFQRHQLPEVNANDIAIAIAEGVAKDLP